VMQIFVEEVLMGEAISAIAAAVARAFPGSKTAGTGGAGEGGLLGIRPKPAGMVLPVTQFHDIMRANRVFNGRLTCFMRWEMCVAMEDMRVIDILGFMQMCMATKAMKVVEFNIFLRRVRAMQAMNVLELNVFLMKAKVSIKLGVIAGMRRPWPLRAMRISKKSMLPTPQRPEKWHNAVVESNIFLGRCRAVEAMNVLRKNAVPLRAMSACRKWKIPTLRCPVKCRLQWPEQSRGSFLTTSSVHVWSVRQGTMRLLTSF